MANMMDLLLAVEMVMTNTLVMTRILTWQNRRKQKSDEAKGKEQLDERRRAAQKLVEKIQIKRRRETKKGRRGIKVDKTVNRWKRKK